MYLLTMKFESIKSVFIITNHLNWYHPVLSGLLENISGSVSFQRSFGFISNVSTRLVQTYLPLS